MTTSVEQLRWERRRKMQVRETFSASLARFRGAGGEPGPLYLACADYLIDGQRRLVDQDRRLVDRLAPRVPASQADDHAAMRALRERLDLADRALAVFVADVSAYRTAGDAGREAFEDAAARFIDVLVNVLGARSHSLRHLTTTLLSEDDWRAITDSTPAFLDAERRAFDAIGRLAPPGLAPELMAAAGRDGARPASAG
jgi:hypothetical protein